MKTLLLYLFFIASTLQISAQMPVYHYVRVGLSATLTVQNAETNGVDLESSTIKTGEWIETVLPESTIERLRTQGEKVDILVNDLSAYYQARNARLSAEKVTKIASPEHFKLGSMGGYFLLDEIYKNFEEMQEFYPEAVSEPIEIGNSVEDRPINAYRFSTSLDDDKPQVLYTAVHHAREPGSASTLIYFLWDLLEKAKSGNEEAIYLLANRVIYVIPMVNPDGYMYNQASAPNGGGLWRRNRGKNGSVDLNRNYGPMSLWNAKEGGSSENPDDDTYRGTSPFSEPETQAIRDFCLENKFRVAMNYHTFGNLIIYPFGSTATESRDSLFFRSFTADATKFNNYSAGVALQTVNYSTRGTADDWMYISETDKSKIFAMTPEVGDPIDGFYAPAGKIIPQCEINLYSNYQTAWSALTNYRIIDAVPLYDKETDNPLFSITIQNTGVEKPGTIIDITLTSLDSRFQVLNGIRAIKPLVTGEKQTEMFSISAPSGYQNGDYALIEARWLQNGTLRRDTLRLQFYHPRIDTLYAHSQDVSKWKTARWETVKNPDGEYMITDSPNSNYQDSDSNFIEIASPVSIVNSKSVSLDFWTKWTIESKADFGIVQVSENDGRTWENLRSSRMKPATGIKGTKQAEGTYGFDGNFPTWVRQECSMNEYIGKQVLLRFGLLSDENGNHDGIYLRDITLRMYDDTMSGVNAGSSSQTDRIDVFPSPSLNGTVYVALSKTNAQLPQNSAYTLQMFDSIGQECYRTSGETSGGNEKVLSISTVGFASGFYRISMQFNGQVLTGGCFVVQ